MENAAVDPVIRITDLQVGFRGRAGVVRAVDGLSFDILPGETVAIVGESGCGKSATALSVLRLIDASVGTIEQGSILYGGRDLLALNDKELLDVRGKEIAMIFQEPMSSLNPVLTIGRQLTETIRSPVRISRADQRSRAVDVLKQVGLPTPELQLETYPYQLSGGMRQRVMIAMALVNNPSLLIADEPTTALDVTIQAQVLELMRRIQHESGSATMLITHDLGVVAEMAQRVVVMYAGRKVEEATTLELFDNPQHPYTRGLMKAGPRLGSSLAESGHSRLQEIPGTVPIMRGDLVGCPFAARCDFVQGRCRRETPALKSSSSSHHVACFYPSEATD